MDQMNQNQIPPQQTQPAPAKQAAGPIIGIIIIIVVLIIGALYFYGVACVYTNGEEYILCHH